MEGRRYLSARLITEGGPTNRVKISEIMDGIPGKYSRALPDYSVIMGRTLPAPAPGFGVLRFFGFFQSLDVFDVLVSVKILFES